MYIYIDDPATDLQQVNSKVVSFGAIDFRKLSPLPLPLPLLRCRLSSLPAGWLGLDGGAKVGFEKSLTTKRPRPALAKKMGKKQRLDRTGGGKATRRPHGTLDSMTGASDGVWSWNKFQTVAVDFGSMHYKYQTVLILDRCTVSYMF